MWRNSKRLSSKFPISNNPLYLLSSASSSAEHGGVRPLLLSHSLSQSHPYSPSPSPSDSLKLGLHRSDGVGALSAAADLPSLASRSSHLARHYGQCYWELSKVRLSMLVVATSGIGFILGSGHAIDFAGLCCTCAGTMMVAASANSLNQVFEKQNDAKMNRTKNRPLPSGRITIPHAVTWASAAGLAGTALLASKANMLAAGLGASNLILYAFVYTPLKQIHPVNTWVGAVVGAIPPLLGHAINSLSSQDANVKRKSRLRNASDGSQVRPPVSYASIAPFLRMPIQDMFLGPLFCTMKRRKLPNKVFLFKEQCLSPSKCLPEGSKACILLQIASFLLRMYFLLCSVGGLAV